VLNLKINFKNIYFFLIYFQIKKHFKKIKTNRGKPDQLANHLNKGPRTCKYALRRLQKINELLIPLHSQKTTQFQQLPFSLQSTHNPQDQKARTKLRWVTGRQSTLIVTIFVHKWSYHRRVEHMAEVVVFPVRGAPGVSGLSLGQ